MRRVPVQIAATAAAFAMAACGGSAASDAGFVVSDSAGVALVVNGAAGALGDSLLPLRRDLAIGTVDGPAETQFFRIFSIDVDAGGRVYVMNGGTSEVRVFAADGAYIRSFGRRGSGPGEIQFGSRLLVAGDSVVVADGELDRAVVFDTAGTVIDTWPLSADARSVLPLGPAPGGWIAVASSYAGWRYEVGVARRDTTRIAFYPEAPVPAGAVGVDGEVGQGAEPTAEVAASSDGGVAVVSIPRGRVYGIASPRTMTANSPVWEPDPAYAVDGAGRTYVSHGVPYRIEVHEPDGRLARVVLRTHEPVPATTDLYDRYFGAVRTYYDTTTQRHAEWDIARSANVGRQDLPRVDVLPALGRLYVSYEGAIWVERPDLVEDPVLIEWTQSGERQDSYWDVFDADGRFLGTARFAPGFAPRVAIEDGIIGVERDELDVEHVVRYRIPRPDPDT